NVLLGYAALFHDPEETAVPAADIEIRSRRGTKVAQNATHLEAIQGRLCPNGDGADLLLVVVGVVRRRIDDAQGRQGRPWIEPNVAAFLALDEPPGVATGPQLVVETDRVFLVF